MNPDSPRKSRFRFTIRELLFAVAAIAAFVALAVSWYEQSQPFDRTGFFDSLDGAKTEAMAMAIGPRLDVEVNLTGVGGSESIDGTSAHREVWLTFLQPLEDADEIIDEVDRQVRQILRTNDCRVTWSSTGASTRASSEGDPPQEFVTRFSYGYEKGHTRGYIAVHRAPESSGRWKLFFLMHEFGPVK